MVKFLHEFEVFYCILENRFFISKIKRLKVTDYAALNALYILLMWAVKPYMCMCICFQIQCADAQIAIHGIYRNRVREKKNF